MEHAALTFPSSVQPSGTRAKDFSTIPGLDQTMQSIKDFVKMTPPTFLLQDEL
jgi:hypothetical protein